MPYLRVVRAHFDPANAGELERLTQEFAAAYKQLPGLQHVHGGADRAGGTAVTVGIFDTEEHARFDPAALGPVGAKVRELLVRIEGPDVYEVTL